MTAQRYLGALILVVLLGGAHYIYAQQRRWQMYEREMQDPVADPPGAWDKTEFAFGRLRYRSYRDGYRMARWGVDANKSDRQFIVALRRLSRVNARSVEQIVDVDSDDMYDYPWLYAVGVGDWVFNESQAAKMREFFARGGSMMVDDFHNEREWADFMAGIHQMLPGHQVVELKDDDPIFHTVYDLSKRFHIPGYNIVDRGTPWERGGIGGHYRAVVDENGRVEVAICFNMDLGDAWEWADDPLYPEKYASLAFKVGVNYVTYAMTH